MLIVPITCLIAAAAATNIYHVPNHSTPSYHHAAEIHQSGASEPQYSKYTDQPQAFSSEDTTLQRPLGEKTARILSQKSEITEAGYTYGYETENGIKAQESGQNLANGHAAQGAYSYTGDDGQVYTVTYTADENGFRAQGSHLPTPPPIPEAILQSIQLNAKAAASGVYDDGSYKENQHPHQENTRQPIEYQSAYHQDSNQFVIDTNEYQHQNYQPSHFEVKPEYQTIQYQVKQEYQPSHYQDGQKYEANGWPISEEYQVGNVAPSPNSW